ncbi:MAG: hypothetical protein CVU62_09240 [Deltaproteobacteria bacterium HGW-Deltaproteobacteria-2]|jgi:hypothetical protein|nr:MAG: hypothetical protein CVU62_09240 [Deltaproteobacteria bacterium HGW-Deltaproteobacteria-2]
MWRNDVKKYFILNAFLAFVVLCNGCVKITPVKNLALPPVSIIEGNITRLDDGGFDLTDDSGSIYVRAELPENIKLKISVGEKVKVYGNLQGGKKKIFDGYVIKKSSGEQIIVSNPSPHFGFILQSSFK